MEQAVSEVNSKVHSKMVKVLFPIFGLVEDFKHIKKVLAFLCLFVLIGFGKVEAQTLKVFTNDSVSFYQELEGYMMKVRIKERKEKAENLLRSLKTYWYGGVLSEQQRQIVYENANILLKRKLKPFPYFYDYLNATLLLLSNDHSEVSFINWQKGFRDLANIKRSKPMTEYVKSITRLLNAHVLYKSPGFRWKVKADSFFIQYDTVPSYVFKDINLVCRIKADSSIIYDLDGAYYPTFNLWKGSGGRIDWSRAGWSADSVYALLPHQYEFPLKKSSYSVDSVNFYHKYYFDEALIGKVVEKVVTTSSVKYVRFPRFDSYTKRIEIPNIYDHVDYVGGFRMEGFHVVGFGDNYEDASLTFFRDDKLAFAARGSEFIIKQDKVDSKEASINLYIHNDSIFHSGLQFRYLVNTNEIMIRRSQNGISYSPFHNTYHDIDMYCESMFWGLEDTLINFGQVKGLNRESRASFESIGYYSEQLFNKIQGIDEVHPLAYLSGFYRKNRTKEFILEDIQVFMRKSKVQVERMLIDMANLGFIYYDTESKSVLLLDKLFDYLLARGGKIDYDVIKFSSRTNGGEANASLNYLNKDLYLNGVNRVLLSDSQQVYIYPRGEQIIMKENRDFLFSGRVDAGLFKIYGDSCSFDYNKFELQLPLIDSVVFSVKTLDTNALNPNELVKVRSTIADLSGDLKIDYPDNKSGLKPSPDFPIFTNKNEAFVYYDQGFVHDGVYDRTRFKYHVFPFVIDSLDNFSTDGIQFEGYLESNLFPNIEQALGIMPDYSLGFSTFTPEQGLSAYGGKGVFYDSLSLSNRGVVAAGTLDFLTSVSKADSLIFFPDSMNAVVEDFHLEELLGEVEYPLVQAENVYEHWQPYSDSLIVNSQNAPFMMYKDQNSHEGSLILTSEALKGEGVSRVKDGNLHSDYFVFKNMSFGADTSDAYIYSDDSTRYALGFQKFKSDIDFNTKKATFKNNIGNLIDFAIVEYTSDVDALYWDMEKQHIDLQHLLNQNRSLDTLDQKSLIDAEMDGALFVSLNEKLDSLKFYSSTADYDLKENVMEFDAVRRLFVADAAIFPQNNHLVVREGAKVDSLINSNIIASRTNKSHVIREANVHINSSKEYLAQGYYAYDGDELETQNIFFEEIRVDSTMSTIAKATIVENDNFMLNPYFQFKGDISLKTSSPFLNFIGGYQIQHDCQNVNQSWVYFQSELNPKKVVIPWADTLIDLQGNPLFNGLVASPVANDVYPVMLSSKYQKSDYLIFEQNGQITYDKGTSSYKIASSEKLNNFNLAEPYFSFNTNRCMIHGAGEINVLVDSGYFSFDGVGSFSHFVIPDSTVLHYVLKADFPFSNSALRVISDSIRLTNLKGVDVKNGEIGRAFEMMLGKEAADKYKTDISLYGAPKRLPTGLDATIVFNDVQLYWNQQSRSYISYGPIGVALVGKVHLNKYVDGWIEVVNKRSGQEVNMYLKTSNKNWYFFNYANGVMQSVSSDNEYNNILLETKESRRKFDDDKDKQPYEYILSTEEKQRHFVRKMRRFAKQKGEN